MPCTYRLSTVILELAQRVGLDPTRLDVGLLNENVRGLAVTNQYSVSGTYSELAKIFLFDPSNHGGVLHFVPRGQNAVATILEDDLVDDGTEIEEQRRADAISIPRVLHVSYFDVAGGNSPDHQASDRAGDHRATGEMSLATPLLMNADEAGQAVAINHKVMIEDQRSELKFAVPDSLLRLAVADCVFVQRGAELMRARLVQVDLYEGYQQIKALRDRQSAYTSAVQGIPAAPTTAPPSPIVGPTLLEVIDIPSLLLRDAHDKVGFYVAVSGTTEAWQGATVELSHDGGQNYTESQSGNLASIMGETTTVLGDHPTEFVDSVNVVRVDISTAFAELEDVGLEGILDRQNLALIGDEVIQFGEVDEITPGVWELSQLLRGRRGTDPVEHAIGERFVVLDPGYVAFIETNLSDIGRELTFRATSFGAAPGSDSPVESITFQAGTQIERAVAYLSARRDGNDLHIDWQGVGRLGAGVNVAHGVHFTGYRVRINDNAAQDDTVETTAQSLVHDVTGGGSPVTVTVWQLNDITGPGPAAEITIV